MRNMWQQANTVKSDHTEYGRIRNHLHTSTVPDTTTQVVLARKKALESLGARAFDCMK
jgi:hypothetical protein